MDSRDRNQTGPPAGSSLSTGGAYRSPLGGTMDAPPMPVADTFTEEVAVGTSADSRTDGSALPRQQSGGSDSSSSAADTTKDVAGQAADTAKDVAGQAADTAKDLADQAKTAQATIDRRVKEWIDAHPLVAVGAGLIGGIVLGGSGGGGGTHHHHYHGDQSAQLRQDASGGSQSSNGQQQGQSHQQQGGGILGIIQQTGLLDTLTQSAERLMKSANGHAAELARQRVPGFDEQMRQKSGSAATAPPRGAPASDTSGKVVVTAPPSTSR